MPDLVGTRLKHYELIERLGEGGMGVVFKARDTHLDRFVAIKVLPQGRFDDSARKQRFVREAKAASALNHSAIVHVYDIDSDAGTDFIAMEYVAGVTLGQVIGRRALAMPAALKYAIQMADALAAAHAAGIVHRDLKPANVMVSDAGSIKVLDFGLAKLVQPDEPDPQSAVTQTMRSLTEIGTVIGTTAYMSPEQAEGRQVDARSDIFSFGAVLYEMVTGRRAFPGKDALATLSAVVHQDPVPVGDLAPDLPVDLQRLIHRCLQKDPDFRVQHMDDVKVLLRELTDTDAQPRIVPTRTFVSRSGVGWALAGVAAGAIVGAAAMAMFGPGPTPARVESPVRRFQIEVGSAVRAIGHQDSYAGPALSPDGTMVAYTMGNHLWIRYLRNVKSQEVADSDGAQMPFWSPGSETVAYAVPGALKSVAAQGGPSAKLADIAQGIFIGGTWGTAGTIVFGLTGLGLYEIPDRGGEPKAVLTADRAKGEYDFHAPHFLPDGHTLVFHLHPTTGNQYRLMILSGRTARPVFAELVGNFGNAIYTASGYLIYDRVFGVRGVYAVPFSLSSMSPSGEPFLIAEHGGRPSVSRDGTLVYELAEPEELVLLDRTGKVEGVLPQNHEQIRSPAFSPDDARVAYAASQDGNQDVWIQDRVRGGRIRLTDDLRLDQQPAWSPSGEFIAYTSGTNGSLSIVMRRADGSGDVTMLVPANPTAAMPKWVDANTLAYLTVGGTGQTGLWYRRLGSNDKPRLAFESAVPIFNYAISPDGRFVAYVSRKSLRNEVYVRPFPDGPGEWQVSTNGGTLPQWSGQTNELFYVEDNTLMAVPVETKGAFRRGPATKLFDGDAAGVGLYSFAPANLSYAVTRDGRHVIAVRFSGGSRSYLTVVENWLAEFRKRQ